MADFACTGGLVRRSGGGLEGFGPRRPGVCALGLLAAAGFGSPALAQAAGQGEVIVVTGARTPVAREKIGGAVTVVTGARLDLAGIQYLGDALRGTPGVAVSRSGSFGGATQIRIRGAEANHVLVLVDGVEVAAADLGEVDFSSLLAADVQRIEVVRGPQSGLYGSNALAGVVNIVTRRGGEGSYLEAAAEAGSFETRQGRLNGSIGDGRSYVAGAYAYRVSDGIDASRLGDEKDGDENATVYLRGGSALTGGLRLDANARYVDKRSETDGFDFSGGPNQGLSIDDESFSDTVDWSLGAAAELALMEGRWVTILSGAYTDTELVGGELVQTFGNETSRTKIALQSSLTFGGAGALSTLTGFAEREEETYLNTVPFDPSQAGEQERTLAGLGVEYRLDLRKQLFLSAAARRDLNDDFDDATTYSLGASWVLGDSGLRLHASAGTGVTNPTFSEQFGFVPGQFVGNPDLAPERAEGVDFGLEQTLFDGAAVFDATIFRSTLEDEIVNVFPSVANDPGESERRGVELSLAAEVAGLTMTGAYTLTDAEDPDGTDEVRRPEHAASFDVSGRFMADRVGLFAGVIYNGEMLDDDFRDFFANGFVAEKTPLEAYTLVRVAADYRLTDRIAAFGRIENLFDEDYEEVISYGAPGRAFFGGLRLTLDGRR